ncbi:hypothetical protein [Nonomuraea sp. CA-141351]|uniref:hypothetical protein n=1 Tax=Nonomuraea sp. CA-141351 TaxID=3239996 RepID=UPI003D8BD572
MTLFDHQRPAVGPATACVPGEQGDEPIKLFRVQAAGRGRQARRMSSSRLGLSPADGDHRRVRAVLTYLGI